uniref:Branched-chain-amino-acid aminotransferase n=1 Tax=uncultured Dehalococcoidia bacterium TaxID=498747 RepID=A0A871Y7N4_9CHLR|nr:Branched-chain-amino-acid aminotransferase 2 [uncultured Dehalococcoidia bacterium]
MDIKITRTRRSRLPETDLSNLGFGEIFSDHMFSMDYADGKWQPPVIMPYRAVPFYPSMTCLHYGQAIFEGLKAFRTKSGKINIFRPDKYHARMNRSCRRLCIPEVDYDTFLAGLTALVKTDKKWVPSGQGQSLYLRPFIIATDNFVGVRVSETYRLFIIASPVGSYYKEGINPIKLMTSGEYVRAVKGGLGEAKTPANYAASLLPYHEAKAHGFAQVLWLDAIEHKYVEEVGTTNIFFVIGSELITPPLDGTILSGITRDTVIELAKMWKMKISERRITIDDVIGASRASALKEVFGTGTAAVVSPVGQIKHGNTTITINNNKTGPLAQKLYDTVTAIQYADAPDDLGWNITL